MPRKNKGKNKNRKSSGIGSTQGRQRDDVTGLTINMDGLGEITSDEVFGMESGIFKYIRNSSSSDFYSSITRFEGEVEFDSRFLVGTGAFETSLPNTSGSQRSRLVLQGEFKYRNGKPTYARIDSMGQSSMGFRPDGNKIGWGTVTQLGIEVNNPTSAGSWQMAISSAISNSNQSQSYEIGAEAPGAITGNYAAVVSFGNGRFFYEGWENEPFSTNLL